MTAAALITEGRAALGIELGSTRIKACLVGDDPAEVIAVGSHEWENDLVDGVWTYSLEDAWTGLQAAYADLTRRVRADHGVEISSLRALGVSAMMHGYLAFDETGRQLVPFRTWRNTSTGGAAAELSGLLGVNIPLRWSVAHLGQAVLDSEQHVASVRQVTTLAGYVHERLTGERVLGVGDASGMFPVDSATADYDADLLARADDWFAGALPAGGLRAVLPRVLAAGADAGRLTAQGAALLDPTGRLQPGALLCPPEGDAGTGMVATNSVAARTGNVSAGTSIFAMVVLEHPLAAAHEQIDLVTTPSGEAVAMVHCNNGASELAAWVGLFERFAEAAGTGLSRDAVYELLLREALAGEGDAGGLLAYNHLAGEPVVGLTEGRPLLVRTPESRFTLANVIRAQLHGVFATLALGMRVLAREGVRLERLLAHGGVFRTEGVAQRILANALDVPVVVDERASEGGAWGIAVLAAYAAEVEEAVTDAPLASWLESRVFASASLRTVAPHPEDVRAFTDHLNRYEAGLEIERAAVEAL